MTTYYTLDRRNRLVAGTELRLQALDAKKHSLDIFPDLAAHTAALFPDGLSDHGERHLPARANIPDANIELIWEYIRRAEFSHRPSRLTYAYWNGEKGPSFDGLLQPQWEVLLSAPVRVMAQVA